MRFLSDDKEFHPISPEAQRELKIYNESEIQIGNVYYNKEGGERLVVRVFVPAYAETKDSQVTNRIAPCKEHPKGLYAYHTNDAEGTECRIIYKDENGKSGECSPSEFVRFIEGSKKKPKDTNKVARPKIDPISLEQAKAIKDSVKPDEIFPEFKEETK